MNPSHVMNRKVRPAARTGQGTAPSSFRLAFTLIEMLVVIAIIGIVAAISVPAIKNFQKADADAAAARQLLDDIARARQFAISRRSEVHMVFVPAEFWNSTAYTALRGSPNYTDEQKRALTNLLSRQMVGYNFISPRSVGDQPGQSIPQYLDEWRSLPEGMFIATNKFSLLASEVLVIFDPYNPPLPQYPILKTNFVRGFESNNVPFPTADSPVEFNLPCLTFNSTGQLVPNDQRDEEIIPLARGRASPALDANKRPIFSRPTVDENPRGNSTNAFALIVVDRLTGRAHIERPTPAP